MTQPVNMDQIDKLDMSALNDASWAILHEIRKFQNVDGHLFNNLKGCLAVGINTYNTKLEESKQTSTAP